ncbi:hypothetical protein AB205_0135870 [Aquarana catesbeiana]|uniref:Uncharacterized protein n=1 Tax=Aquarana catesbeiana TaxID=8400 RepID=A0A2G9NNL5_AQUCT|nr:hypothetical protein AB205_0135870 [Aquarana catesbeiana]
MSRDFRKFEHSLLKLPPFSKLEAIGRGPLIVLPV